MTEPHKRVHRHPNYKTADRVNNCSEYDKAWRARGDISLWVARAVLNRMRELGRPDSYPVS